MARNPGELDIHLRQHHIQRTSGSRSKLKAPLKQLGARGPVSKPLAADSQPVVVKVDTPGAKARGIQPGYLQHGKGVDQTEAALYGTGAGDPHRFTHQMQEDHHRFTLYVSFPAFPQTPQFDRTVFIAHFLRQMERDMGLPLAWMAANHYDTAHPHTHILVRGVSQGEDLYMKPGYFKHGLREQASRLLTAFVGPVREQEQTRQHEQFRRYQQNLDREPRRLNGIILGSEDPDLGQRTRLQILERAQPAESGIIPLARPPGPPVYGHEGLAAHVTRLWERVQHQRQDDGLRQSQQRGWGR
jgi:hypothetical protein